MKKILSVILITVMAAILAVAPVTASGCNSECEHSVSSWTVVKEATCSSEGLREGRCGKCYDLIQETIPIDPDNHTYGDWVVVATPSISKTGIATKTCTGCGDYVRVTLPTIDDISYTSTVTKRPTASSDGESLYTYSNELGDISFTVTIGSDGIQTVSDAVSIGSSSESHDMVRSATGTRGDKRVDSGQITDSVLDEVASSAKTFSYELYKKYTHLIADDGSEYWMALDGDEIYGYMQDSNGNFLQVSAPNYFYGFRFYLTYTDKLSYYYGTENFLSGIYTYAKSNPNGDLVESINSDGSYSFSFGTYTIFNNGAGDVSGLYSMIEMTFTLTDSYTIKSLDYYSVTYANDSSTYDNDAGEWGSDATFDVDEDGYAYVKNSNGLKYIESYSVTQTERKDSETELTSPYTADTRFYTDFDITYNGSVINEKTSIELVAGTASGYDFQVANITPSDAIGDSLTFYYKKYDADGKDYDLVEVNVGTESSVGILLYMRSDNTFQIKCNISGDITFVVCSRNVTKEFTVTFTSNAPTELYPTVYDYNGANGYVESTSKTYSATAEVYAGQPLYYKASLSASESGSCTESFDTAVTYADGSAVSASDYSISDEIQLSDDYLSVSSFTAYKTGAYVLTLTSTEDSSVTCTITVTVTASPDVSQLLSGTYTGTFSLTGNKVTVTFGNITKENMTDSSGSVVAIKCTVVATVSYTIDVQVQCTFYTSADGSTVLSSTYSELTAGVDMLECEVLDDVDEDEYYFTISLNEAFDVTVSHYAGDTFEANESAILKKS